MILLIIYLFFLPLLSQITGFKQNRFLQKKVNCFKMVSDWSDNSGLMRNSHPKISQSLIEDMV
jgi:hypothetical protein